MRRPGPRVHLRLVDVPEVEAHEARPDQGHDDVEDDDAEAEHGDLVLAEPEPGVLPIGEAGPDYPVGLARIRERGFLEKRVVQALEVEQSGDGIADVGSGYPFHACLSSLR